MSEIEHKNVTAFDLDGVFIPDCDQIPDLGDHKAFLELTQYMKPVFKPVGEWILLTGRPAEYEMLTKSWLLKYFTNQPKLILHGRDPENESNTDYKLRMIKENRIDVFIESDREIVDALIKKLGEGKIIVHFETFTFQE
ncbi:hypothetical protein EBU71_22560 [bacterium]|nr:hypothetical protein [Candidatus Elulimicrobium humile]